jgi:nicotinamidase-related amidase
MTDTALVVVDMLNPYRHQDAEQLTASVSDMIEPISELASRAREREDVALIYVNDNYGDFAASRDQIVQRALDGERPDLVKPIRPFSETMFLPKVRHSAFYSTALEYLLNRLGVKRVILAGQVTEQCILYSALDAYVRHFAIRVPPDAVAYIDAELGRAALRMMERNMRAELVPSPECLD